MIVFLYNMKQVLLCYTVSKSILNFNRLRDCQSTLARMNLTWNLENKVYLMTTNKCVGFIWRRSHGWNIFVKPLNFKEIELLIHQRNGITLPNIKAKISTALMYSFLC